MITLLYLSSAVQRFSDAELVELLTKAREKNDRLGVTGMLLYHDGNFLQVLEGDEASVRPLFDTINKDTRHQSVIKLIERPLPERQFGEWSMAFRTMDDLPMNEVTGYSDFLNTPFAEELKARPSAAYQFLLAFRETAR
jgi:hypothetical protein